MCQTRYVYAVSEFTMAICRSTSLGIGTPTEAPKVTGAPLGMPIHLDAVWRMKGRAFFDVFLPIEAVDEDNADQEQAFAYDTLFSLIGVDPETVPPEYKRPVYRVLPEETAAITEFFSKLGPMHGRDLSTGFVYIQPIAGDTTRSLPVPCIQKVLEAANEVAEKHNLSLLIGNNQAFSPEITDLIAKIPSAINIVGMVANARGLAAIIANAKAVISTGSLACHLAAALEIPCLTIWGAFDPDTTAKYYTNMRHIWHHEACPHAPCHHNEPNSLPAGKCPKGAEQKHCACFDAVTAESILTALQELLK